VDAPIAVRPVAAPDRAWVDAFLAANWSARVARRGELVRPAEHPMLVAQVDGRPGGLLTYVPADDAWEILTLHAAERHVGVGTALVARCVELARAAGSRSLWLVTTNDNVDALRFYQRRGFRIRAIRPGAVDAARAELKPEIPEIGDHGIPLRDEIELERAI
jgi:ribosomal protein S18 acetylase RimI-like enzyme